MRYSLLHIALLLILGSAGISSAQEAELSLYNKIVPAIEKSEPQWKLHRKAIMPRQVVIQWVLNQDRALISVALLASQDDAKDRLKARVTEWQHVPEAKVTTNQLKDFGNEGYLLKTAGGKGAHILFRKGAYLVEVFGPADDVARKFAQHVSEILPTSNNSLDRSGGSVFCNLIGPALLA